MDSSDSSRTPAHETIEAWVDEHADYLFAYAISRVRDRDSAEDLVQETFLAAVRGIESFRGDSSPRTWLTGLLRNKIVDHFRRRSKDLPIEADDADPVIDSWFDRRGMWAEHPTARQIDPSEVQERADFWAVVASCLERLPERAANAFSLRVIDGMKSDEVCKVLSISSTNLWVLLHRARARLRICLDAQWFDRDAGQGE